MTLAIPWTPFISFVFLFAFTPPVTSNAHSPWALSLVTSNLSFNCSNSISSVQSFSALWTKHLHLLSSLVSSILWPLSSLHGTKICIALYHSWNVSSLRRVNRFYSPLYPQCLAQCLEHCLTLTVFWWINKCMKRHLPLTFIFWELPTFPPASTFL